VNRKRETENWKLKTVLNMRLRIKLGVICALAATVPLAAISFLIVRQASATARNGRIEKLEAEARAAESIYEKRLIEMRSAAQGLAVDIAAKSLLEPSESSRAGSAGAAHARVQGLQDLLARARDELSLDFLIVADNSGQVVARQNDAPKAGEMLAGPAGRNLVAEEVINAGIRLHVVSLAASVVERREFLVRMWLDKPATIQGAPAVGALIIESAAPIMSSGRFLGIVLAGQMLNNYYKSGRQGSNPLQTAMATEVRQQLYPGIDQGAGALVALGDTVIASSVLASGTSEPVLIGSKHDPDKNPEIIGSEGQQYLVSWRPVRSIEGAQIGAIGVAMSTGVLGGVDVALIGTLAGAIAVTIALVALGGAFWGGVISRRLAVLSDAVSRMRVGELSRAVRDTGGLPSWIPGLGSKPANGLHEGNGSVPAARDEIEELADNLDRMRESFKQAIERLRKTR
jgi:HAMP domain-containing protein